MDAEIQDGGHDMVEIYRREDGGVITYECSKCEMQGAWYPATGLMTGEASRKNCPK
jgi:hypothetical protein